MIVDRTNLLCENRPLPKRDELAEEMSKWFTKEKLRTTTTINEIEGKFRIKVMVWEPVTGIHIVFAEDSFTKQELIENEWRGVMLEKARQALFDLHNR